MEMPKPGPDHERLAILAGKWIGAETMHPSPWDPAGGAAEGRIDNRVALDGFVVIQEYEQRRDGRRTFAGHGVFWWDAENRNVVLDWHDSMGMPPNRFVGAFDGDTLTLSSASPMGTSRTTFVFSGDGRYTFRMEMSADGATWTPMLDAEYRRVAD